MIDRILYKLDELVRPFVHKVLVVIEPLLIDEDYYARVEGREIIANLSKAAGLATMIAAMRPDIDNIDECVLAGCLLSCSSLCCLGFHVVHAWKPGCVCLEAPGLEKQTAVHPAVASLRCTCYLPFACAYLLVTSIAGWTWRKHAMCSPLGCTSRYMHACVSRAGC